MPFLARLPAEGPALDPSGASRAKLPNAAAPALAAPGAAHGNLSSIWWLHPGKLLTFFTLPLYAFLVWLMPALWPELIVLRYGQYMDGRFAALGGACLLVAGVAAWLGARVDVSERNDAVVYDINPRFLWAIGGVTVLAYAIWFGPALARGQLFLPREELNRTPGVTSFTQFGVPFVICYMYATRRALQPLGVPLQLLFFLILGLTLARVFIWSERLALIEIGVPAVALLLAYARPRGRWMAAAFSLVARYGPLLAVPLLLGFFAITEVFRSWSSEYYQSQNIPLGEFMVSRLVTYYYTALNSGAGLLATAEWPSFELVYILNWFYKLPFGVGQAFAPALAREAAPTDAFLSRFGDPEFTNMSGIFPIIYDVGVWGGLTYFGLFGLFAGFLYRAIERGRRVGILLFPSVFVACLEILRIAYTSESRCFLIVVGAVAAMSQLRPRPLTV